MSFVISVAHAAHRPERVASYKRLAQSVRPDYVAREPGKPHEWSSEQWCGALDKAFKYSATHCVMLNDDVIPCVGFRDVLAEVIKARPAHLINLWNCHELAKEAQKRGLSWLTSVDGLIGNAYVLPVASLRAFLEWRTTSLIDGAVEKLSEDQLLNLWAMQHGALIWHTVPALVEHDTSVPSCYGNTQCRSATVGPLSDMSKVNWESDAVHIGRVFKGNHSLLLTHVKGDRLPLVKRYFQLAGDVA